MTAPAATAALPRRRLLGYGVGSVGTGVFSAVPGLLLLYYLTDVLGVSAAIAGAVLVVPKAWDVVLNPIVGAASDREAVRTGRRTRLLLIGGATLPFLFAAMFAVPADSPGFGAGAPSLPRHARMEWSHVRVLHGPRRVRPGAPAPARRPGRTGT